MNKKKPTHRNLSSLLDTKIKFHFTDRQLEIIKRISNHDTQAVLIDGPAGTAKAQPLDSLILTPDGWIKMGDIQVGDWVMSERGEPIQVDGVFPQGEKEIYEVIFSDGSSTFCCMEHLWFTQTYEDRNARNRIGERSKNKRKPAPKLGTVKSLKEISETLTTKGGKRNHYIPLVDPIPFEEQDHLIDPYLMGILLGDGGLTVTTTFSTKDEEIVQAFKAVSYTHLTLPTILRV